MARIVNTGGQKQGHFDAAFNWCRKEFVLIGFGMNSMGAHFNPVSMSIANSESKEAIKAAYSATCAGLYSLYNTARLCKNESCGFCTQVLEQISEPEGRPWKEQLASDDAANLRYMLDKPSSDHTPQFFSWAKEEFGENVPVQQCGNHLSGNFSIVSDFLICFSDFLNNLFSFFEKIDSEN